MTIAALLMAAGRGSRFGAETPKQYLPLLGRPVLRHAAQSLNPVDRAGFLTMLRTQGRAAKPSNQRARALRQEGWGSLGDPVFDPVAVKAKLAQARNLNLATRGAVEDAVVDFAAGLPRPERAALGEALRTTIQQNNGLPTGKNN